MTWLAAFGGAPREVIRQGLLWARYALAIVWVAGAFPLHAQLLGNPAISMTVMTISDPAVANTRISLVFSPSAPSFSIVQNDGPTAVIAFNDARLAPGVTLPVGPHGLVQAISAVQNYGVLTLALTSAGPIRATVQAGPGGAVSIAVTPSSVSAAKKAQPDSSSAMPMGSFAAPTGGAVAGEVFEVLPLKYADVSEVVGILTGNQNIKPNDDFTPQEPSFGSASLQGGYYGSGTISTSAIGGATTTIGASSSDALGTKIDDNIGIDRRLNAIILRGSPDRIAQLKEDIAKLDVPVTSVLLETVFVELTQTGARNLGIDFNNANNQIATASYAFNAGGFPGVTDTGKRGGVAVNLQAAIYAQIAKGEGSIISKPSIAAQSGQSAKIVTGDALPILTSIALSGVNAVQQQVQYVNVGVILQIAPRVSDDGFVTSHIYSVVSSVTGFSQGYPTISQREATTSATVRDGESFIIGGLTQESSLKSHGKIPGLGDVPVMGSLFKTVHDNSSKTELYVIVTPHIVRGPVPDAISRMIKDHSIPMTGK
jgi:general secretion pathway protein D